MAIPLCRLSLPISLNSYTSPMKPSGLVCRLVGLEIVQPAINMEFPHLSQLCPQPVNILTPFCAKIVIKAGYNVSHRLLVEFWVISQPRPGQPSGL